LREVLADWERLTAEVDTLTRDAPQSKIVSALREKIGAARPVALDPLTQGERESELQMWLEEHGVEAAWEHAPNLVSLGWEVKDIVELSHAVPVGSLATVVKWVSASGATFSLLHELAVGAGRIAEIVQAVKAYAYLDQAPMQEVDVHAGLENTLIILRHKLREGVTVIRQFAPDLPRLAAYGSELNQVWTNIIDNAIEAMQGQGQLVLRTSVAHNQVLVEIEDNGPGIPPEIQPRIFDPFFTTKPLGAGTGLGLHIAHNIVSRHRGQIQVTSQPGVTCFQVSLPIQLQRG
jgi:signal transduction histidine kinase